MTAMLSLSQDHHHHLADLSRELLAKRRLILASNRGPVEYYMAENGAGLQCRRGSGGVVTALSSASQHVEVTWVASAMGEGDRIAAESAQGESLRPPIAGQNLVLRFVVSPRNVYHKYYNVLCNPLLWFLQHYMWNSPYTPNVGAAAYDAWVNGYVPVNEAFARAIVEEAQRDEMAPFVMLHDYHLYLTAGYVRQHLPRAVLQHFIHIPWPAAAYWQLLPSFMRHAICENLCSNDIVGLQSQRDVHNFLHTCESFLEGAEVDYRRRTLWHRGHLTTVNAYPISIDVDGIQRLLRTPRVREHEEKLRRLIREITLMRVDRVEPSKNIVRGFRAFDMFLERYPQFRGRLAFLAFLVPSRTRIRQYRQYMAEVNQIVSVINAKYGDENWQPITTFMENNYPQAIAAMSLYDVLLVNPVIDGMNLVAKEGPVVNRRHGVLILSETVGAYEQLGEYAISVAPADLEGTAQAIYTAITMSKEERRQRAENLRRIVFQEDIITWLCRQFEDLLALA